MITHNSLYNIDPFYSNRLLDFKVRVLNTFAFVKKTLSIKSFKTGLITYLNKDFGKFLIVTEGILKVVPELDDSQVKESHPVVLKALKHFIRLYSSLEGVGFLDNQILGETCSSILSNLYTIESFLRHSISDSNFDNSSNEDKELNTAASIISLNSVFHTQNAII